MLRGYGGDYDDDECMVLTLLAEDAFVPPSWLNDATLRRQWLDLEVPLPFRHSWCD